MIFAMFALLSCSGEDRKSGIIKSELATEENRIRKEPNTTKKQPQSVIPNKPATPVDSSKPFYTIDNIELLPLRLPSQHKSLANPVTLQDKHKATLTLLKTFVKRHGLIKDNPWAMSHALLALGPSAELPDGQNAISYMFENHAQIKKINQKEFLSFPRKKEKSGQSIPVEPHKDLILKVLTEIGTDPSMKVTVGGKQYTIGDLYRGTLLTTYLTPTTNQSSYSSPNDMPWSVQALSTYISADTHWKSTSGAKMNIEGLTLFLAAVISKESQSIKQMMQGKTAFKKDRTGIFKYTCGGSHLLQGLAYANARGVQSPRINQEIAEQITVLFYRFPEELKVYDQLMKEHPKYKTQLLIQRLKFVGHFIESTAKIQLLGYFQADERQTKMILGALDQMTLTVSALRKEGLFDDPKKLLPSEQQLYLDLIGDSAHATYGMELISGARKIRY